MIHLYELIYKEEYKDWPLFYRTLGDIKNVVSFNVGTPVAFVERSEEHSFLVDKIEYF